MTCDYLQNRGNALADVLAELEEVRGATMHIISELVAGINIPDPITISFLLHSDVPSGMNY